MKCPFKRITVTYLQYMEVASSNSGTLTVHVTVYRKHSVLSLSLWSEQTKHMSFSAIILRPPRRLRADCVNPNNLLIVFFSSFKTLAAVISFDSIYNNSDRIHKESVQGPGRVYSVRVVIQGWILNNASPRRFCWRRLLTQTQVFGFIAGPLGGSS